MKALFYVVLLVAGGIGGTGFYRGWFQLGSDRASDKSNVTLTVDKEKIREDGQKALDAAK